MVLIKRIKPRKEDDLMKYHFRIKEEIEQKNPNVTGYYDQDSPVDFSHCQNFERNFNGPINIFDGYSGNPVAASGTSNTQKLNDKGSSEKVLTLPVSEEKIPRRAGAGYWRPPAAKDDDSILIKRDQIDVFDIRHSKTKELDKHPFIYVRGPHLQGGRPNPGPGKHHIKKEDEEAIKEMSNLFIKKIMSCLKN